MVLPAPSYGPTFTSISLFENKCSFNVLFYLNILTKLNGICLLTKQCIANKYGNFVRRVVFFSKLSATA